MEFRVDLSHLPLELREKLRAKWAERDRRKFLAAERRQQAAMRFAGQQLRPGSTSDALGPLSRLTDPYFQALFRRQHGETIDQDPEFDAWLKKRHGEQFFVRAMPTKIMVGWQPAEQKTRFRKVYAEPTAVPA